MYDIIVIGMGPAGMAVSAMAVKLGLNVLGIEKNKVGGECLNCGCIPSKALLKAGEVRKVVENLEHFGIHPAEKPDVKDPLSVVRDKVSAISGPKTMKTFEKVELVLGKGNAEFVDAHTVEVDEVRYHGKRIFIATGTEPMIPPIPGLDEVDVLTNVNLFEQKEIPESLMIIGGGAIGTEMAQAFSRLGSKVVLAHMDPHLLPTGDKQAGDLLQENLEKEGIRIYNSTRIEKVAQNGGNIVTTTDKGEFSSEKILIAAGRMPALEDLKLEKAGIRYTKKGITVNQKLQTNRRHIYAVGDCNGISLFSHAAMHQGMIALMNALNPTPFAKMKNRNFQVPWSVFTKPEIAQVGLTEEQAKAAGLKYKVVQSNYADYGRAIADGQPEGFVKVITNGRGKIFGATIVGESASEMIHEWTMAIQYKHSLFDVLMMQHSFPTISLMNKRIAEGWMMELAEKPLVRKLVRLLI
ncbi:MAG: NAD(P)/FAD-dependent oxidoreductase [Spirochaetota bacterium]|nr:NAD(P)/FAD-dependent oxidoreductase [Spirochaetota bacterium]